MKDTRITLQTPLQDYQKEMAEEFKELNGKIWKLESFITNNDDFSALDTNKRTLMKWQLSAMKSYREALYARCLDENFIP